MHLKQVMEFKRLRTIRINECEVVISHSKTWDGYHRIEVDNKKIMAHRAVYEHFKGQIPDGMVVRHTCDNASCINPEHLTIGTVMDNVMDRVKRNRSAKGERNGRSKLTSEQVIEIKSDNISKQSVIARKFGVDPTTVRDIKKGKIWGSVLLPDF